MYSNASKKEKKERRRRQKANTLGPPVQTLISLKIQLLE